MRRARVILAFALTWLASGGVRLASADEGGVSFWVPGFFGSFAASQAEHGWSLPITYYHMSADVAADQELELGGSITAGAKVSGERVLVFPTYVFHRTVLGAQAALGAGMALGFENVTVDAVLSSPHGPPASGKRSDDVTGITDLYPQGTLKWNRGAANYMLYGMVGVPVGSYEARLANLSTNHWSLDAGGGITFLNNTGHGQELSIVTGFTYNFENPDTDYRNGADAHIDWALSQFINPSLHAGLVGYFYSQMGADSGSGAVLGDFKSQITGLGPELGSFFDMGDRRAHALAKVYWDFAPVNRPSGWNLWLSFGLPL